MNPLLFPALPMGRKSLLNACYSIPAKKHAGAPDHLRAPASEYYLVREARLRFLTE